MRQRAEQEGQTVQAPAHPRHSRGVERKVPEDVRCVSRRAHYASPTGVERGEALLSGRAALRVGRRPGRRQKQVTVRVGRRSAAAYRHAHGAYGGWRWRGRSERSKRKRRNAQHLRRGFRLQVHPVPGEVPGAYLLDRRKRVRPARAHSFSNARVRTSWCGLRSTVRGAADRARSGLPLHHGDEEAGPPERHGTASGRHSNAAEGPARQGRNHALAGALVAKAVTRLD